MALSEDSQEFLDQLKAHGKEAQGISLARKLALVTVLTLSVFIVLVPALEFLVLYPEAQARKLATERKTAEELRDRINERLSAIHDWVDAAARSGAVQSLTGEDKLVSLDQVLPRIYAGQTSSYLINNQYIGQLVQEFGFSFANVDIVRSASTSNEEKYDVYYDKETWTLQIARKVGDQPYVLLMLFHLDELEQALRSVNFDGSVEIVNLQAKPAQTLTVMGSPGLGQLIELDLNLKPWTLRFLPKESNRWQIDPQRVFVWIAIGAAGVLAVLLLGILMRSVKESIKRDISFIYEQTKAMLLGQHGKSQSASFREFNFLVLRMRDQFKRLEDEKVDETSEQVAEVSDPFIEEEEALFSDLDLDEGSLQSVAEPEESYVVEESNEDFEVSEVAIPQSIFRAYDIRGVVDETLNEEIVVLIGRALATEALERGFSTVCVGYDGRLSSEGYCEAICAGITSTGADAIVVGLVPTPVLYFATHYFETGTGVMITGSHNPANYNGFKMMIGGETLSGETIQALYQRINQQKFQTGQGSVRHEEIERAYMDTILDDIAIAAPLKVVVDAGNGVAGGIGPELIEELGCEVIPLYCDIDGTFPNHHPDPGKPDNLKDLIEAVKNEGADIGLAYDGDGDRVGVVTRTGKIIWPDRLLMLFAQDVISRNPGADIIYDVKCSRRLNGLISGYGGRPVMWKTGHSLIKAKMKETGALLAGEMSGHMFFKERWFGFDDGIYSGIRLLEILGASGQDSDAIFEAFPEDVSTPEINIQVTDESKFDIIDKLCERQSAFENAHVTTIDGLRVDFSNGWGLCRASNTTPMLVLRFEADDEAALEDIKASFKAQLQSVDSTLDLDF